MKQKKKDATRQNSRKRSRQRWRELIGILLIFSSLFGFISLISYDSQDPSWANVASPSHKTHNYGGKAGAYLAETLLQVFGLVSFLLPLGIGFLGFQAVLPGEKKHFLLKILKGLLFIFVLSSLLFILLQKFSWRGAEFPAGGLLGNFFSDLLIHYLNHAGSLVFLFAFLFLLLIFSTGLSFGKILKSLLHLFSFAFKEVRIKIVHYQKSKQKEKMRQMVIKKYSSLQEEEKREEKRAVQQRKEAEPEPRKEEKAEPKSEPLIAHYPVPSAAEKCLFPEMERKDSYRFPPITLLDPSRVYEKIDKNELYDKKMRIEEKLREFKVEGEVREYHPGPIITIYEFYPKPGIKVSQVANLTEDLSLALGAESVRIQRIPGKSSLGVEIPNNRREIIKLRDIIQSEKFQNSPSRLTFALGKTIHGDIYVTDLSIMPHLLIAGATGTGKSVCLNSLIASILYKASPEEVKLILIDPKRLEFTLYDGIPHLLSPVINDPKKAGIILMDTIKKMDERYRKLSFLKVRNIEQYNNQIRYILKEKKGKLSEEEKEKLKPLPYIVIIIDELSELMMVGAQDVENCIARLSQLARAVGIHLVMATQRPSIDVITGTIKNNFSCRIAFRVPSKIDSRIILDTAGAEKLLGLGDMLFLPPNFPRIIRLHCAYISLPEISRLVKFVKEQGKPTYDERIVRVIKGTGYHPLEEFDEKDELYEKAVELVLLTGQASASYLQRKLKLGYARAARIIDQMEEEGLIGPSEGSKPREILVDPKSYLQRKGEKRT